MISVSLLSPCGYLRVNTPFGSSVLYTSVQIYHYIDYLAYKALMFNSNFLVRTDLLALMVHIHVCLCHVWTPMRSYTVMQLKYVRMHTRISILSFMQQWKHWHEWHGCVSIHVQDYLLWRAAVYTMKIFNFFRLWGADTDHRQNVECKEKWDVKNPQTHTNCDLTIQTSAAWPDWISDSGHFSM